MSTPLTSLSEKASWYTDGVMTPDTTNTPSEQPFPTRRNSRRAKRIARQKRQRKINAAIISGALLLTGGGAFAWNQLQPVSALEVSELFPSKTDDLRVFSPQSVSDISSAKVLDNLQSYGKSLNEEDSTTYLSEFTDDIKNFTDFHSTESWVGSAFAHGSWEDESLTAYAVKNSGKAKEFMTSPECNVSFLKTFCGEGNFAVSGKWLLTGTPGALALHTAEDKNDRIKKESSLAVNTTFAQQTGELAGDSLLLLWTNSENVTSFLPMGLNDSFPKDARIALSAVPAKTGISLSGSMYKGRTDSPLFKKQPISDSVTKLPANTVTAISVSEAHDDVENMLTNPEAFINTQDEWVSLRNAIEGYGAALPDDLTKIFGETTTFSLNEGSVGNKVAGTLRMTNADSETPVNILSNAAKESSGITEMYSVRAGEDDFLIESHSPITNGAITDNPLFTELVGSLSNSIAVAYIHLDDTWALLDSNYSAPSEGYDGGVLGINIMKGSSDRVDLEMNWKIIPE